MAQEIKTVMVIGGTGNLGPYLVAGLSEADFKVSILSRRAPGSTTTPPGVAFVQSDYTFDSLVNSFKGQDAIVCATAATSIDAQKQLIDAAVAAKVKRFLPNEFGGDTTSEVPSFAHVFKEKADVLEYLKSKETDGLSWTAVCTGIWIDWCLLQCQKNLLGFDIKTKTGILFDSGQTSFTATTVAKVGQAVAAVLKNPKETKNEHVFMNSFEMTQARLLEALERANGGKFSMESMTAKEITAQAQQHLEKNDWGSAYYKFVTGLIYGGHKPGYFPEKAEKWNKVLGLEQTETIDEMATRVLASIPDETN